MGDYRDRLAGALQRARLLLAHIAQIDWLQPRRSFGCLRLQLFLNGITPIDHTDQLANRPFQLGAGIFCNADVKLFQALAHLGQLGTRLGGADGYISVAAIFKPAGASKVVQ